MRKQWVPGPSFFICVGRAWERGYEEWVLTENTDDRADSSNTEQPGFGDRIVQRTNPGAETRAETQSVRNRGLNQSARASGRRQDQRGGASRRRNQRESGLTSRRRSQRIKELEARRRWSQRNRTQIKCPQDWG